MPGQSFRRFPGSSAVLAAGLLSVSLAACGGSSHPATTAAKAPTKTSSASGGSSVTTGPVHATLSAPTHRPVATKNWTYTVTATDDQGHPLSGTTLTEFAFQGMVVGRETPPVHRLRAGHLKDTIQFPKMAIGQPLELQVIVRTSKGSVTLRWPVTVRK
jgi:hypothetical protein